MHGRAMRIPVCQMLNYPFDRWICLNMENLGSLYLLHHNGSTFTVESYNNTRHLQRMNAAVEVKK